MIDWKNLFWLIAMAAGVFVSCKGFDSYKEDFWVQSDILILIGSFLFFVPFIHFYSKLPHHSLKLSLIDWSLIAFVILIIPVLDFIDPVSGVIGMPTVWLLFILLPVIIFKVIQRWRSLK